MKKTLTILVVFLAVIVLAFIGYNFANTYAQKKARAEVEKILKEAHLDKDVSYRSLKANIFSRSIKLNDITWNIKQHGEIVANLDIKSVTVTGKPDKDMKANFEDAELINLNVNAPLKTINKPIITIEKGFLSIKKKDGETKSVFKAEKILINEDLFENEKNPDVKRVLFNVFRMDKPINMEVETYANENTNTFSANHYTFDWEDNFKIDYSFKLENIDLKSLKNATKEINNQNPNPLAILNYLSKLYEIKPVNLKVELKDLGLIERVEDFIAKENKTTKENLLKQFSMYLKTTPFKDYSQPIMNFAEGKSKSLYIKVSNPQALTVGDIIQKMQSEPLFNVLKIDISN